PFCEEVKETHILLSTWDLGKKMSLVAWITALGTAGSRLDSLLGGVLQASVVDVRSGKVVEGDGGVRVPVTSSGAHTKQDSGLRARKGEGKGLGASGI